MDARLLVALASVLSKFLNADFYNTGAFSPHTFAKFEKWLLLKANLHLF